METERTTHKLNNALESSGNLLKNTSLKHLNGPKCLKNPLKMIPKSQKSSQNAPQRLPNGLLWLSLDPPATSLSRLVYF